MIPNATVITADLLPDPTRTIERLKVADSQPLEEIFAEAGHSLPHVLKALELERKTRCTPETILAIARIRQSSELKNEEEAEGLYYSLIHSDESSAISMIARYNLGVLKRWENKQLAQSFFNQVVEHENTPPRTRNSATLALYGYTQNNDLLESIVDSGDTTKYVGVFAKQMLSFELLGRGDDASRERAAELTFKAALEDDKDGLSNILLLLVDRSAVMNQVHQTMKNPDTDRETASRAYDILTSIPTASVPPPKDGMKDRRS